MGTIKPWEELSFQDDYMFKRVMSHKRLCKKMLERGIDGGKIFFTDETQIQTGVYIKDSIRLSKENQIKLKEGKKEAFDLINRQEKKYESSIMI
ncbi:MAG: hypothetical protein II687_07925, partial [Selenomonadaceae bacterium]|nr:hypothetical protein [Selenomonadaceae bacterium]